MDYDHLVTRLSTWLGSIAMLVMAAACASGFHTAAELEQQPAAALAFPGAHETVAPTTHDEGEVGAYVRRYYAVTASSGAVIAWYQEQLRTLGFAAAAPTYFPGGPGGVGATDLSASLGDVTVRVDISDVTTRPGELNFTYLIAEPPRGV